MAAMDKPMGQYTPGERYRFRWKDSEVVEVVMVFVGTVEGQPLFEEPISRQQFTLDERGHPEIEPVDEAAEWLKNYQPDLKKFAPTFMGLREKQSE